TYGLRADLRELAFGDVDAVHAVQAVIESATGARARRALAHRPTTEAFEGTYDLTPLEATNVGFRFLDLIAGTLQRERIPAVAILTPTNHRLLHDYIDVPEYTANLRASERVVAARGVRVVDWDAAFPSGQFIDNDHLTAEGNRRLASRLQAALR